ncbi:MAG: C69 family dipeptidase [Anaerolineae bacterium]|nr:C69 family dipeptidase [Anaerolineae bacterium]
MCDTVVITPEATADGVMLFGKNSDREPNEAHTLALIAAADHPAGSTVRMTYIEIPQAEHTYRVLLAKPFWIWGAEMGVNEHGVAIGNEAVFTRAPYVKDKAMIGMDLLRLGLERGSTAQGALEVMTGLLETYGQGGNCGFRHPFYYHNSFWIADPREAWVFETAGPHWAARRVQGVYTISNGLTIGNEWDLASKDLVNYAVGRGWCKSRADFDFARCYSEPLYTSLSDCRRRCARSRALLEAKRSAVAVQDVMDVLRDHGEGAERDWRPDRGLTGSNVCMHAGFGPVRASQSVGSLVSRLEPKGGLHFLTGTAAPCTSVFKPVWLDSGLPDLGPVPDGRDNPETLFWQHERLHRATLLDYPNRIAAYHSERDALEGKLVKGALDAGDCPADERLSLTANAFQAADECENNWLERVASQPVSKKTGLLYQIAWNGYNRSSAFSY